MTEAVPGEGKLKIRLRYRNGNTLCGVRYNAAQWLRAGVYVPLNSA